MLLTVFGPQVGTALFGLRSANLDGAAQLGAALAVSAFGLLPYGITMLQMRVFYALTDSRTPTLIQLGTVAVKIPLLLLAAALLPAPDVVLGLAAANSASFLVGAVLGQLLLRRRLGRIPTRQVLGAAAGAPWSPRWSPGCWPSRRCRLATGRSAGSARRPGPGSSWRSPS